jgi:hypothetical protein
MRRARAPGMPPSRGTHSRRPPVVRRQCRPPRALQDADPDVPRLLLQAARPRRPGDHAHLAGVRRGARKGPARQHPRRLLPGRPLHPDPERGPLRRLRPRVRRDLPRRGARPRAMLGELEEWLRDPKSLEDLDPELREAAQAHGPRAAAPRIARPPGEAERAPRRRQPLGRHRRHLALRQGGAHPTGIRVGGGGGRSALAVADARRFREFRRDLVLDTRQIAAPSGASAASPATRASSSSTSTRPSTPPPATAATSRSSCRPSATATSACCSSSTSAAAWTRTPSSSRACSARPTRAAASRSCKSYYFHNCVYQRVYEDARFSRPVQTQELLRKLDPKWTVVLVGDAYMHPAS